MCLNVEANSSSAGKGTHVSVFAFLMRGEFDDHLKWPFQGHVTVVILNQLENNNHITYTISTTNKGVLGKVTGRERASSGWGYHTS